MSQNKNHYTCKCGASSINIRKTPYIIIGELTFSKHSNKVPCFKFAKDTNCYLLSMPMELKFEVMLKLDYDHLLKLFEVCKEFTLISRDFDFWLRLAYTHFNVSCCDFVKLSDDIDPQRNNPRQIYLSFWIHHLYHYEVGYELYRRIRYSNGPNKKQLINKIILDQNPHLIRHILEQGECLSEVLWQLIPTGNFNLVKNLLDAKGNDYQFTRVYLHDIYNFIKIAIEHNHIELAEYLIGIGKIALHPENQFNVKRMEKNIVNTLFGLINKGNLAATKLFVDKYGLSHKIEGYDQNLVTIMLERFINSEKPYITENPGKDEAIVRYLLTHPDILDVLTKPDKATYTPLTWCLHDLCIYHDKPYNYDYYEKISAVLNDLHKRGILIPNKTVDEIKNSKHCLLLKLLEQMLPYNNL